MHCAPGQVMLLQPLTQMLSTLALQRLPAPMHALLLQPAVQRPRA